MQTLWSEIKPFRLSRRHLTSQEAITRPRSRQGASCRDQLLTSLRLFDRGNGWKPLLSHRHITYKFWSQVSHKWHRIDRSTKAIGGPRSHDLDPFPRHDVPATNYDDWFISILYQAVFDVSCVGRCSIDRVEIYWLSLAATQKPGTGMGSAGWYMKVARVMTKMGFLFLTISRMLMWGLRFSLRYENLE